MEEGLKPSGFGLVYAAPYLEGEKFASEWHRWCYYEDFKLGTRMLLLDIEMDNVYTIDTKEKYLQAVAKYHVVRSQTWAGNLEFELSTRQLLICEDASAIFFTDEIADELHHVREDMVVPGYRNAVAQDLNFLDAGQIIIRDTSIILNARDISDLYKGVLDPE